jgi:hypothetical protein
MIRYLLGFCLLVCAWGTTSAQRGFNGLWVGTLVQGEETYDIRLDLEKDGRKISGSSLIILSDTSYIELHLNGLYHEDRSMNIYEIQVLFPEEANPDGPYIMRTYQLLYRREFNDYFLEGWWQERHKAATDSSRRFGHIRLYKLEENSKA